MTHQGPKMFSALPPVPRSLVAGGALLLTALTMLGSAPRAASAADGIGEDTTAEVFNARNSLVESRLFGATAIQASNPACNHEAGYAACFWEVQQVQSEPGSDQHPWVNCVGFHRSRLPQHVTCSIAKSKSTSVTATVGGSIPPGISSSTISGQVGYNITKTTTLTTGDTVDVPKNTSGTVQWGAVYSNFKKVTLEYEECYEEQPGRYTDCESNPHANSNHIRYVTTEQFAYPDFQVVASK